MSSNFFKSYQPQSFTLPDSVMYCITKKPSNPSGYQKLIQSCKYFFCKNPILVFHCLFFKDNEWRTCSSDQSCLKHYMKVYLDVNNTVAKIWIVRTLSITPRYLNTLNKFTSTFISKLYKNDDITALMLKDQTLNFDELLLFPSTVNLFLHKTSIISKNGSLVSIPKLMKSFPLLKVFYFEYDNDNAAIFTEDSVKEILKIPHFCEFTYFILFNVPETFDLHIFYEHMMKNKTTEFGFVFSNTISQEYRNRLEIIVNEILAAEFHDYKVPYIRFPGMDIQKMKKLKTLSGTCLCNY